MALQDQSEDPQTLNAIIGSSQFYDELPGLDHVRLIKLLPGSKNEQLQCEMETLTSIDSEDLYDALSYVWGDSTTTEGIICNGSIFQITTNLADGLRQLRYTDKPRMLWADAICINQTNDAEKSSQVRKMGDIYQAAKQVLVWLGRDNDGIAYDAFLLIYETNQYLKAHYKTSVSLDSLDICKDKSRWKNVTTLFALPWFRRVWVIQETGLAKDCTFMWGRCSSNIAHFIELKFWENLLPQLNDLVGSTRVRLLDTFLTVHCWYTNTKTWRNSTPILQYMSQQAVTYPNTFLEVLNVGKAFLATNKRDYIYAFLGSPLARTADNRLLIEPDYQSSVADVYFDIAHTLLHHPIEAPWVLSAVKHLTIADVEGVEFPSWLPRWDKAMMVFSVGMRGAWYNAGGVNENLSQELEIRDDKSLAISGFIFDEIIWTSRTMQRKDLSLDASRWDEECRNNNLPFIETLLSDTCIAIGIPLEQLERDLSVVLAKEVGEVREKEPDKAALFASFVAYRNLLSAAAKPNNARNSTNSSELDQNAHAQSYWRQTDECHNRRLIYTKGGLLGLGPHFSQEGDICSIFFGVSVPIILRKCGGSKYNLVGDSYVNGVMHGELMEEFRGGTYQKEIISIV
jgi:hypothetical protein